MLDLYGLPKGYRDDIKKAVFLLKKAGCTEIYLFGSLAEGHTVHSKTDIDLAVRGLPDKVYFKTLADLLFSLQHNVDLVSLDTDVSFAQHLIEGNRLEKIA